MKRFLIAVIGIVGAIALAIVVRATVVTYSESFTATTYKDASNTTADWNTAAGELRLFPFVASEAGNYDAPGVTLSVAVGGNLAFAGDAGTGLRILDITETSSPVLVGTYSPLGSCYALAVSNTYVYAADGPLGLSIINAANAASPTLAGSLATSDARGVTVLGTLGFVADNTAGLRVVDVSNPASPALLGTYDTTGEATSVVASGLRAYVADGSTGLQVIDIANPASPALLGSYDTPGSALGVAIDGTHAYVADGASGLLAIDVSNAASPALLGTFDTPGNAEGVFVAGDRAYVADGGSGLVVINIRNPASMTSLLAVDTPGTAHAVVVDGTDALVADHGHFRIIEVGDPNVVEVGQLAGPAREGELAVSGDIALVSPGGQVVDISDPTNPFVASTIGGSFSRVAISGHIAVISNPFVGQLQTFDVSNPSSPIPLGTFLGTSPTDMVAVGHLVYLVEGYFLPARIVDIADPTTPTQAWTAVGRYSRVLADDRYVYTWTPLLTNLEIFDVSNPAAPAFAGAIGSAPDDMCVSGGLAYAVDGTHLNILDVRNPPVLGYLATYTAPVPWHARAVTVSGNRALVATDTGIWSFDVTDPTKTILVSKSLPSINAVDMKTAGEYTLISHNNGFEVAQTIQSEILTAANVGQSTPVDGAATSVVRARLTTTQTANVTWELAANGDNWQAVQPDNAWNRFTVVGDNLRWRSHHEWSPGLNPTVSDLHIDWLSSNALVQAVTDRPGDQGGFARVTVQRSGYDFTDETQSPIVNYGVWTRIDDPALTALLASSPSLQPAGVGIDPSIASAFAGLPLVAHEGHVFVHATKRDVASAARQTNATFPPGTWELVANVPSLQNQTYVVLIPTAADAPQQTVVVVTAHTAAPSVWFASPPDSGLSVDNIAPGVPSSLVVAYNSPGGNALAWDPSADEDFQYFRVYRGATPGFTPSSANLVRSTATTGWSDPDHHDGGVHYKVTAVDHAGNESAPASPGSVTAIGDHSVPEAFALYPNVPNPFNPTTRIRYDVARGGGEVSLRIYDVSGRVVRTLVDGLQSAGRKSVEWDGRDDAGSQVASGVYFCRLVSPSYQRTNKMVLTK
jgi:hypothetical protein